LGAIVGMSSSLRSNLVKSMTGFARVSGSLPAADIDLEVKAVNSRYLELSVKGLPRLGMLERELKTIFQRLHSRGRIDVLISRRVTVQHREVSATSETTDSLVAAYVATCRRYGAPTDHLSHFIGSLILRESAGSQDAAELGDEELQLLKDLSERASGLLAEMRMREGAALVADIKPRLAKLSELANAVEAHMSSAPGRLRERLSDRLRQLPPEVVINPERLALEIALLAERVDVSEELSRLAIHLGQFNGTIDQGGVDGIGRKLDFLTQEIGRELNTIGSKAQDALVQGHIVEAKAELEKIREQVQNVE
jgi:uncharacterized protein (TIGR00255 family)